MTHTSGNPLLDLRAQGQSIWLDDLHRRMLADGSLARLVEQDGLSGVTSNPAIFAAGILQHEEYVGRVAALLAQTSTSLELYEALVLDDIRGAAELLRPVFERSGGRDGFVSLEVSPHLAHDASGTVEQARRLWQRIERPNAMIKVPGTSVGLQAVCALIAAGVNVNVTLLFSVARYRAVSDAYMSGLEERVRRGADVSRVASVASFFLSRIDSHVDPLLDEKAARSGRDAGELRGRAAVACACGAYEAYLEFVRSERWQALARRGACTQRLLWASTSTKDRTYSDVKYVEELIAPDTVNTLPLETLAAFRDHGRCAPRFEANRAGAAEVVRRLAALGIDLEQVAGQLEREGVRKFADPFDKLQRWLDEQRRGSVGTR